MAQTLMEIMERSTVPEDKSTGLQMPVVRLSNDQAAALMAKSEVLSRTERQDLRLWAENLAPEPSITKEQFARHFSFIASTLPSKGIDDYAGKQRFAVFFQLLCSYSEPAIAYMAKRVCSELDWQPTPKQCLTIISDYKVQASDAEKAIWRCRGDAELEFNEIKRTLKEKLMPQAWIDALDEKTKRLLDCQLVLRFVDGRYIQRQPTTAL